MSWSTRSAISTAAFSVKAGAINSSGRARLDEMRCAMRRVRTVVLPVPAPAMMSSGPSPWTTASCWADESPSKIRSAAVVAVSVDMCGQYARRGRHARSVRSAGEMLARDRSRDAHPLQPGIDVEPVTAQEADEGDAELARQRHGQAAGRGDGADDRHPRHQRLLDDLEAAPAADHHDVAAQGQPAAEQRPAYYLIERVVPSDVLPDREQVSLGVEERGGVEPAGGVEDPLARAQPFGKRAQHLGVHLRPGRNDGTAAHAQGFQAGLAADSAGAGGVEVTLQGLKVRQRVAPKVDVDDVVALVVVEAGLAAMRDAADLIGAPDDPLAVEEPRRELEVGPRSAHGDRHRPMPGALAPPPEDGKRTLAPRDSRRPQADLQRLLGGELVRPRPGLSRLHDPDAGLALAVRTVAQDEPSCSRLSFDEHERQAEVRPWARAEATGPTCFPTSVSRWRWRRSREGSASPP